MATSLASQLYRMRTVDRMVGTERSQKIRASFLFDGKQAADMDIQTIFDIGRDGLRDLCKTNSRFQVYATTLFSEAVKDMDRVLQTKKENNKLDETIRSFLYLLAPQFLTKPAGKALEWLIRRFRIQEFNAKDILAAFLPFHETKAFLTMLTIITFTPEDMRLFGFLVTQRKARRLLDRATLMAQCLIDRSLLAFICDSVFYASKRGLDYPGMHSFYVMVISQYIGQLNVVNDSAIQFALPYVLDGLSLRSKDAQTAAYMVLGSLATRVTLTQNAAEQSLCAVAQDPADVRTMTMCLVQLIQTQVHMQSELLPKKLLRLLAGHKDFPKTVSELASAFDIDLFVRPLLTSLVHFAFSGDAKLAQMLTAFVPIAPASSVTALCEKLVREYIACGGSKGEGAASEVIDSVQLRFGQQLEDAIGAIAGRTDKQDEHKLLYELKSRVSSGSRSDALPLKETATTLFLSINHADAGVRVVAAKALSEIVEGSRDFVLSEQEAAELALDRLRYEDNADVLSAILSLNLSQMIAGSELVEALVSIISGKRVAIDNLVDQLVGHLLSIDAGQDEALYLQIVSSLFPYLLASQATKSVTRSIASALPSSAFAKYTSGWLSCLSKLKDAALGKSFNKTVVELLAAKLAESPDAYSVLWRAQLKTGSSLALAIGARAVDLLAASGSHEIAVDITRAVIFASKNAFAANGKELQGLESTGAVLVQSTQGTAWNALLAECQPTKIAVGALSAVLNTLPRLGAVQPNRWFAEVGSAERDESAYCGAVRNAYLALVARDGVLTQVDGVLIGRMLNGCLGNEWAEFLAAAWVSADLTATARARSLLAFAALANHAQKTSIDYQTLLPAIIVALADSDQGVRAAAAGCINVMKALHPVLEKDKKAEQNIYQYDAVYGAQSARLQYLPSPIISRLITLLDANSSEMIDNSWTIRTELEQVLSKGVSSSNNSSSAKLNSQARAAVGMYLVSHIAATDRLAPALQLSMLSVLEPSVPAGVLEQLFPLIAAHVQSLQQSSSVPTSGSSEDNVLRALFRACFSPSTAAELRGPDGSAYWLALLAYAAGGDDQLAAYIQQLAFERLGAQGFVASLGAEAVTDVTSCLLRVADSGNSYEQSGAGSRVSLRTLFATLQLDAEAAADELSAIADRLGADAGNASQPAGKRAKKSSADKPGSLAELAALLELVGCSQSLATDTALVPPLFALLHVFVAEGISDAQVPDEYIKQLVLGLLTRIFDSANERSVVISESAIRVDVIVQTIRTSPSPQTHNQTLALLAAVATQHSQAVLHHVMAVFTFMGANVLRQDDEYSFHVIQQTLEKVLPPLVRLPSAASRASQVTHAGPVLRVFVDALSHIPRHRRMALFSTLVRTMGPKEYAPAVVSLLLEKNVAKILKSGNQAEDRDVASFALSLVHGMSAEEQIHTATILAHDLALLPAEPSADVECADVYIDVAHMQTRDLRTYRLVALDFAHQLLTSRQFAAVFASVAAKASVNSMLASATAALLETIATLAQQHAQLSAEGKLSANVAETAWRKAIQLAYSVLDDVNALMDRRTFVSTVIGLLEQNDLKVRRKVLTLANAKLAAFDTRLVERESSEIDEILEMMMPVAQLSAAEGDAAELIACKQAALLCVATAAKKFAALRPTLFTQIVGIVISPSSLQSTSSAIVSSALVALAVSCTELGSRLIPLLPQYLPTVLKHLHAVVGRLSDSAASEDDLALLASALSAMQAIVENMSAFLAPSLSPLFTMLMHPYVRTIQGTSSNAGDLASQVRDKADSLLTALSKNIPPRQLLPAQFAFHQKEASKQGAETIAAFVEFVGKTAGSLQRNYLLQFYKPLFKFFLSVFDATRNPAVPLAEVQAVEDAALSAFMRFVIKLNENLFKPLFLSFVEWATADPSSLPAIPAWTAASGAVSSSDKELRMQSASEARLRVFYRALNMLFDKLKTIVAPYYSSVIDTTVAQLERYGVSLDSIELQEEADRAEKPVPSELWCAVLESLYHSALYDSGSGFWTDANFLKIYRPLANQLANTKVPLGAPSDVAYEMYIGRVRKYLAPAASQLCAAAGNDAMWKSLNQESMMKSRSDDPAVRVGSLLVLQSLYEKLGEEFLILLPETIPYLAELLEDDNSRVERTTQETIKIIESYLGESLQAYLK
ncbi:snoRNA-binding rRNA-processing protein utp10 [Coemansia asiatica]|uniref:U3 small nucleolar RNA-associated protein 10 n=1 Tax=Coemansia asiatica TaxID=1052880 RepID=A0A9W8CIN3_9FUNG|nr:snoRNA-binding rRNA-processing protein utp10 [Coemansia asiatica]